VLIKSDCQLGLSAELRLALQHEGIHSIEDLGQFEDEHWVRVSSNFRNPVSVPDPTKADRQTRPQNFTLVARSLNRLKPTAAMVRIDTTS